MHITWDKTSTQLI